MRNLKLAFRTLFKTPFVAVVAVLSLALGIGANAAIFSLFNELLLQPLPVSAPDRLANFGAPGPQFGSNSCNDAGGCDEIFSYPMLRDLQKANTAFSGIAGHFLFGVSIGMSGQTPISGRGVYVTANYFSVLGLRPAAGQLFTPRDEETIGGNFVAVLSHGYWETQLGSDPSVVGKQISVNGQQMTILGVAPRGFTGTTIGARPDVFVPITMRGVLTQGWTGYERRDSYWVYLFGRLKPGVNLDQATSSINTVYHILINDSDAPRLKGLSQRQVQEFRAKKLELSDGRRGQSSMIKKSRTPITLLFAITGIVLLIACANIANLLLARAANRTMEMAVRLSLGATRRQLVGQVLTESLLLAAFGGLAGLAVAHWTLAGVTTMLPPQIGSTLEFSLNWRVLGFTMLVSVATGLLFGIVPALNSTRPDLVTELRNNSGKLSGSRGAARFRSGLVTTQIALSMALLASAGMFVKSLRNISRVDLGVNIDNMVTFGVSPARSGYDSTRALALYPRIEQALASIPGVTGVTASGIPLLAGNNWGEGVAVEGFKKTPETDNGSAYNIASANYFHVLGVPLLAGRDFTPFDEAGSMKVAIVNEAFAKKFGLGRNAVGKKMSMDNDSLDITIIGLVKDAKYSEVKDTIPSVFVRPYKQVGRVNGLYFYVRSALPPTQILRAIPAAMKQVDPNIPLEELKLMPQQVEENVFFDRMITTLSASFALLATLLAAVGLYGVLAFSIAQRTREIGVRMALGANGMRVRSMVLMQVGRMALVGGVIGILGAVGIGRAAQSLLYQLEGNDPTVILLSAATLCVVAFSAGFIPALRASRIDPMQALRYE